MKLKSRFQRRRFQRSDVPLHAQIANGFAILLQLVPSASRRLTGCYVAIAETRVAV